MTNSLQARVQRLVAAAGLFMLGLFLFGAAGPVHATGDGPQQRGPAAESPAQAERRARHEELLARTADGRRIPVIVMLKLELAPEPVLGARQAQAQRDTLAGMQDRVLGRLGSFARQQQGELAIKRFTLTPAFAIQANTEDLQELLADPEVADVIEDHLLSPALINELLSSLVYQHSLIKRRLSC